MHFKYSLGLGEFLALSVCQLCLACNTASGTVRTRAAYDFQCEEKQVSVKNISGLTYAAEGCGHESTYTCSQSATTTVTNEIVCIRDDTPQNRAKELGISRKTDPQERAAVTPAGEAPTGAVGFEFGMGSARAEEICSKAGLTWTSLGKKQAECSGAPVALSFAVIARLQFCAQKVCAIQLAIEPSMNKGLGDVFKGAYDALQGKYGPKTSGSLLIAQECLDGDFRDCIIHGQVRADINWRWKTGESIALFTGTSKIGPESEPGLYLMYVSTHSQYRTEGL